MKHDESRRPDRRLAGNEPTPIMTHQHRLVVTERGDQKPHVLDQRLAPISIHGLRLVSATPSTRAVPCWTSPVSPCLEFAVGVIDRDDDVFGAA